MNDGLKKRLPLLSAIFIRTSSITGISIVLQLYMTDLGATLFQVGAASSLRGLAAIAFSPTWGALSDKNGRKKYLFVSSVMSLFILTFYPFASNVLWLTLLVFLFASTNAGFTPIATALASESSKRRGVEISFLNTSISIGNFIGKIIVGVVFLWISIKLSLWIFILIFASSVIPLLKINENEKDKSPQKKKRNVFINLEDVKLMKENQLWSVYIGTFLRQFGVNGVLSIIAVYMVYSARITPSMTGFLAGLNPLVQIFSILFFARVVEKKNSKHSIMLGMALTTLSLLFFAVWKSILGISLAYIILGLGYGAFISGATTYVSFVTSSNLRGRFMGLFSSFRSTGVVLGSLTAGAMATAFGYEVSFLFMSALVSAAFLMIWLFFKEKNAITDNSA